MYCCFLHLTFNSVTDAIGFTLKTFYVLHQSLLFMTDVIYEGGHIVGLVDTACVPV